MSENVAVSVGINEAETGKSSHFWLEVFKNLLDPELGFKTSSWFFSSLFSIFLTWILVTLWITKASQEKKEKEKHHTSWRMHQPKRKHVIFVGISKSKIIAFINKIYSKNFYTVD
jgi:hypothetical protein